MILVLTGATGTGKSELAAALAQRLGGEIVNADAFQVYEGLTIATCAPSPRLKALAPHHLYAFVPLSEGYDVARYQKDCRAVLAAIRKRGRTPILVGGSGLYIRAALYDYDFSVDASSVDLAPYENLSDEALHEALAALDPGEAAKIPPANRRRALRSIALTKASGAPKTELLARQRHEPIEEARFFALAEDRAALYAKLDARVERMFAEGLMEETVPLIERYGRSAPAFQAIGVKELFPYLDGKATLEEAKQKIKEDTRRYAKRQETFFRHQFQLEYVHSLDEILEAIGA
jgi:tRNA dimethylallyltransferase